ncbi:MAG: FkbM family methyltransferase [Maritimibacter sp.]
MADGEGILRSRGMEFPDDPAIIDSDIRKALRRDIYEDREAHAVSRKVKKSDIVMELGAGIGYMSTLSAKVCGAQAVHTYEANPGLIPYIRRVHRLNGVSNVELNNALLGPEAGEATFYVRDNILASSMDPDPKGEEAKIVETHQIEVRSIADEMRRIKPTALIVDIEGAEAHVLPHADLSTVRLVVIELHPQWIGEAGTRAVFETMMKAGLTYFPWPSAKKVVVFMKDWD